MKDPGRKKHNFIIIILIIIFSFSIPGQEGDGRPEEDSGSSSGADQILKEARDAIRRESYPYALDLLTEGETLYPGDYRLPLLLGELYSMEELYNLSLDSFLRADSLEPGNLEVMSAAAGAYGRLNRNQESVELMERILEIHPDSTQIIADLGWMYFKTYRPADGERLLNQALEEQGETPGLLMTLGTLYTGLYDYENGRDHYLRSIEAASKSGWDYFSSVAYYNLALLDYSFYQYERSLDEAMKSLELAKRSSGYICLGELSMTRMDFNGTLDAFTQAYNQDETPLSLLSLAELYHKFGMLDAALSHTNEARERADASWMYYFGVDPDRHMMDLHDLYGDIYESMGRNELRRPVEGLGRISLFFRSIKYRVLAWYYRNSYRKLAVRVGEAYRDEGNNFDADLLFYYALENYPRSALKYLARCEEFEMKVAPESYPFYRYEEGMIKKDPAILYTALEGLDPHWERSGIDDALTALIPLLKGSDKTSALYLLYDINPGAFVREGFDLPVILKGSHSRKLGRMLERGGLDIRKDGSENIRFELRIDETGNIWYYSLWDPLEKRTLWTESTKFEYQGELLTETAAEQILNRFFRPR